MYPNSETERLAVGCMGMRETLLKIKKKILQNIYYYITGEKNKIDIIHKKRVFILNRSLKEMENGFEHWYISFAPSTELKKRVSDLTLLERASFRGTALKLLSKVAKIRLAPLKKKLSFQIGLLSGICYKMPCKTDAHSVLFEFLLIIFSPAW